MPNETACEQAKLYFRQGSSDKVCHAQIEASGTGVVVNFAFGRRGSAIQSGTKTSNPTVIRRPMSAFADADSRGGSTSRTHPGPTASRSWSCNSVHCLSTALGVAVGRRPKVGSRMLSGGLSLAVVF